MKKFKSLVLMAVLILSLAAASCGQSVKETQSGTTSEARRVPERVGNRSGIFRE